MRVEHQLKLRGTVNPVTILTLGGEKLSVTRQVDSFLAGHTFLTTSVVSLREENGTFYLSSKRPYADSTVRGGTDNPIRRRHVVDCEVCERRRAELLRRTKILATLVKTRSMFRLGSVLIAVDHVDDLGDFVELRSDSEEAIRETAGKLGLRMESAVALSYFDLILQIKVPPWRRRLIQVHDQVIGKLVFGLVSGVLLSMSIMLGVALATSSFRAVVASVLCLSGGDSISDALGMLFQQKAERDCTWLKAIRYALGTFAGKALVPLSFLIWLTVLPMDAALIASLLYGALLLSLVGAEQALVEKRSVCKAVVIYTALGLAVSGLCALIGVTVHALIPD